MIGDEWGRLLRIHPTCQLDPDGTLALPEWVVRKVGPRLVLAPSIDVCLAVYSPDAWTQHANRLQTLPNVRYEVRLLLQAVLSGASGCQLDGRRRILLTDKLRLLAKLDDEALIVSASDHVQLWNPVLWAARHAQSPAPQWNHDVA